MSTGEPDAAETGMSGSAGATGKGPAQQGPRRRPTRPYVRICGGGGVRFPSATRQDSNRHGRHRPVSFDFLGYTFKPRSAKRKDGTPFTAFSAAISGKSATAIRQEIRRMCLHL